MLNLSYTEIFKKTLNLYFSAMTIKNLSKIFINSLIFRSIIIGIGLFCSDFLSILLPTIFLYFIFLKPFLKSKGNIKVFFANFILSVFFLLTLIFMWTIISLFFFWTIPSLLDFLFCNIITKYTFFASFSGPWPETPGQETSDNYICDTFNDKNYGEYKNNSSKLAKIHESIFNTKNKPVYVIKPYPIIKESFFNTSQLETSTPVQDTNSYEIGTSANELGTKTSTSNLRESNILSSLSNNVFNTSDNEDLLSSSNDSDYNSTVIDLQVIKGIDKNNNSYLMLKDKHDLSSKNLISILDKPDNILLSYDKTHYMEKNCINHKYISFDINTFNKIKSNKPYLNHDPTIEIQSRSLYNNFREVSLNINEKALNEIRDNTLIVESEDVNRIPVKGQASFIGSDENFSVGTWKINIPIPQNFDTINILRSYELTNLTQKCDDCSNN